MNGAIIINKPKNFTSRDVINKLNKILNIKKIGHTGTLDPMATGILICLIGKCTKLSNILVHDQKEYIAKFQLGILTDTLDITGNILKEEKVKINKSEIRNQILSFIGSYEQTVPNYSAVKINGKKLYEYARANEIVDLPKRFVNIYNIEIINISDNIIEIKTTVSKGTYIRSLIRDIALSLNTVGTLLSLERTKLGNFNINNAVSLEDVVNNNYHLYSLEELLKCPIEYVNEKKVQQIKNGKIFEKEIEDYLIFKFNNEIIALYQKYQKNNKMIKPLIIFK